MNCKICKAEVNKIFTTKVLEKYDADFYFCSNCNFLFAADAYWLEEAYQHSINKTDTGILSRNISFSKLVSVLIFFIFDRKARFLDYAGGYGIFTRLMRDIGYNFYWNDPYSKNIVARGFEFDIQKKKNIELITAFEVAEHMEDPLIEFEKMLDISKNLIFSTEVLPFQIPNPNEWWYYGFEHGQHVSFYSKKTIDFIAKNFGLDSYHFNNLFLFTKKKINKFELIFIKKLYRFLFPYVKLKMKSKTFSDYDLLKKELR